MMFKKTTVSVIIILVAAATIIGLSGLSFLIPQNKQMDISENVDGRQYKNMEKIFLITKDNVKIAANYRSIDISKYQQPFGWLIMVHMMPATKESYGEIAERFQDFGYASLVIDLRGHGESDGGPDGYLSQNFDHQKSILDLEAAVSYLIEEKKATSDGVIFIGASIGANLSLQYISEHPKFKTVILLSPGLNYRRIATEPLVKNLKTGQKAFFISSRDDGENAEENQKLYKLVPAGIESKIQIYDSGGHGTDILKNQPDLINKILNFIQF